MFFCHHWTNWATGWTSEPVPVTSPVHSPVLFLKLGPKQLPMHSSLASITTFSSRWSRTAGEPRLLLACRKFHLIRRQPSPPPFSAPAIPCINGRFGPPKATCRDPPSTLPVSWVPLPGTSQRRPPGPHIADAWISQHLCPVPPQPGSSPTFSELARHRSFLPTGCRSQPQVWLGSQYLSRRDLAPCHSTTSMVAMTRCRCRSPKLGRVCLHRGIWRRTPDSLILQHCCRLLLD
jgi:hypothetical protein